MSWILTTYQMYGLKISSIPHSVSLLMLFFAMQTQVFSLLLPHSFILLLLLVFNVPLY